MFILFFVASIVSGFFLAGIPGALLFGLFNSLAIREHLEIEGYSPRWFIISQKRNPIYNKLLMNSVDKSKHIEGKVIDLYIIDIDGRNGYNQNDYNLIKQAAAKVNQSNPALSGRIFSYLDKGFFSRRMVHVELD